MSWETYRHRCQVRVRFGDTDPYGIVYFVSYFRYCHRAIEEFLRSLGLPPGRRPSGMSRKGSACPSSRPTANFCGPPAMATCWTSRPGSRSCGARPSSSTSAFSRPAGNNLVAEGTATHGGHQPGMAGHPHTGTGPPPFTEAGSPGGRSREKS